MALKLKSRTPVKFELSDDLVETSVVLSEQDSEETLVAKLKRIVALVEGEPRPEPVGASPDTWPYPKRPEPQAEAVTTNGWKRYAKPDPPERWTGEVELIEDGGEV
ncbi:hypothetical protein [Streptomyces halobius]|uniref:Lsr2 protein n=1 Tax=Streptomyces halobius TaxID=2879846 RepID=A0ABY4M2I9_9ACTN|nr:hypothetical protein [Streptomyces halobius]UQA91622.1 hypothetical protein K9S39_06905 [Streptomyces halobius]